MNIGIYLKWYKDSLTSKSGNVFGDELLAESLCRYLRKLKDVESAEVYAPNYLPSRKLDIVIYMQPIQPLANLANKTILYLQNGNLSDKKVDYHEVLSRYQHDGYIFYSQKLLDLHKGQGGDGLFLPFGVDLDVFNPKEYDAQYDYDVTYVGNDIKGTDRTSKYLLPATKYTLGLFGNWVCYPAVEEMKKALSKCDPFQFLISLRRFLKIPRYRRVLCKRARGKIPQEKVPVLYSSSKINLNFTLQECVDMDTITLRLYEILACRGFCISDRTPSAEKMLKDCVVFNDGGQDLARKIKYYLARPEERREIAERGYQYVTKHATIEASARKLYQYLKKVMA